MHKIHGTVGLHLKWNENPLWEFCTAQALRLRSKIAAPILQPLLAVGAHTPGLSVRPKNGGSWRGTPLEPAKRREEEGGDAMGSPKTWRCRGRGPGPAASGLCIALQQSRRALRLSVHQHAEKQHGGTEASAQKHEVRDLNASCWRCLHTLTNTAHGS